MYAVAVDPVREAGTVCWSGGSAGAPTVRAVVEHARLMVDADLSFPVILGPDGRVMDGKHRIARVLLDGWDQVGAIRFLTLPEPGHRDCQPPICRTDQRPPAGGAFRGLIRPGPATRDG